MARVIQRVANIAQTVADFLSARANVSEEGRIGTPADPMPATMAAGAPPRGQLHDISANLRTTPRQGWQQELTSFQLLRALSDFDLVRIAITDVTGQVLGTNWEVGVKPEFKEQQDALQDKVEQVRLAVKHPDPLAGLDFKGWLAPVLDEILVTDALTLYPRFTRSGQPIGLEQADGATILPLVDDRGRPPIDKKAPAYQQVIHGRVETEFQQHELWYLPRNRRPHLPYGRSPVENVLTTVNVAIRQQQTDLAWFTTGTMPDSIWSTPAGWSPEQVSAFQTLFDNMMIGNMEARTGRLNFVPGGEGAGLHPIKERDWKFEFLEWMGRVICWSFGVSPLPIVKMMNRASGEMHELSSLESGVKPVLTFVEHIVNRFISDVLDVEEVEFRWQADETEDEAVTLARNTAMTGAGAMEIDEWRKQQGLDPVLDGALADLGPIITTPGGPVFLADLVKAREPAEDTDVAKIDSALIQRAFLEVPVLRRDELRASIGAPPIGGDAGAEFITIAASGDGNGGAPVKPTDPVQPAKDPTLPDAESGPVQPDQQAALTALGLACGSYRQRLIKDLQALRRKGKRMHKLMVGDVPFKSTCIAPYLRADGIGWQDISRVIDCLRKAEPPLPEAATGVEATISQLFTEWLAGVEAELRAWALRQLTESVKVQPSEKVAKLVAARLAKLDDFPPLEFDTDFLNDLTAALESATALGAGEAAGALGITLGQTPAQAATFALERAGELVGMKFVNGAWVQNPNATFAITNTLRQDIQNKVTLAIEQGWSPGKLAAELNSTLGPARAATIARTETAFALSEGAALGYEDSGVELVEILDGVGCLPDGHDPKAPKAAANKPGVIQFGSQADGQVWTVQQFKEHKIGHPNCVRAAVPFFQ